MILILILPTHTGTTTAGNSTLLGRDKTVWKSSATLVAGRTLAHNVFTGASGVPRQVSQSITTPYDAWKHFIPESILRSIVKYTTEEAHQRGDTNFSLSLSDLEAFIALQYARGLYGKNHPVSFLYNKEYGIPIFSKTMPRDRFLNILKYLRVDDKPNRKRSGPDANKFAPIREVFETFSSMCRTKYNCNFSLTIDEQLMPVKSRCPFITFIPNKPDKYGIKFWVLADVETKYVANIVPYLGAQERQERGGTPLAESVLVKLTEKVKGKGYNITCDNFFTSLSAAEKLARNKISIVGTIRKNRRELSPQMTQQCQAISIIVALCGTIKAMLCSSTIKQNSRNPYVYCQQCIPRQMWILDLQNESHALYCSTTKIRLGSTALTK